MTTTDRIRYCSVGRKFEGGEIKIDRPDKEGTGEVCYTYVCMYATGDYRYVVMPQPAAYNNLCVRTCVCVCACAY